MSESFSNLLDESLSTLDMQPGSIVSGVVLDVDKDWVTVHVGLKSEGVISLDEFRNNEGTVDIEVGDEIEVALEAVEDGYGETRISREKARKISTWKMLEEALETGEFVTGRIHNRVKGGFAVEVDVVKAFLPGSLVDVRPVKEAPDIENTVQDFKVIKLDYKRNNVVLSRKAVLEKNNSEVKVELLENLEEGQIVKGVVKNITDYGAFIDLGGIDGLLHITDISWKRINHPQEILKVGDEIEVSVLKYDEEKNRVSLGMKQLTDDPWEKVEGNIQLNEVYESKVVNIADYGVFVDLGDNIEGLIRTSELDWTNKNISPKKVLNLGDSVNVKVIEIDEEKRRLSLSYKQCLPNPWSEFSTNHQKGDTIKSEIKSITDFGIFVGLEGGIDGLVHISDVTNIGKPEDFIRSYKKGDVLETVVLSIDSDRERISLGIKQFIEANFDKFTESLSVGTTLDAEIVSISDTGVYMKTQNNITASLKLLQKELKSILEDDTLKVLQKIKCTIKTIDKKNYQVVCSLQNDSE